MDEAELWERVASGFLVNLQVLALSFPAAYVGGLALLFLLAATRGWARTGLESLVLSLRITPVVVQLVVAYFALAAVGVRLSALTVAVLVFVAHYAAFFVEKFRASYAAVGPSQMEAAYTLGLPRRATARHVLLPQLALYTYPATVNALLGMVKDSAILSVIALTDAIQAARIVAALTFDYVRPFLAAAVLFALFYGVAASAARALERALIRRYGDLGG
jgi:His/Glu/Gln/Arg/opine family amino acid ABC transporter permease subunit